MTDLIIEEYLPFNFQQNVPIIQKVFQCIQDIRLLYGCQNGQLFIFNPQNLVTQQIQVFKRPIISIQIHYLSEQTQFLVSDGIQWKFIEYNSLQITDANFPNGTFYAQFFEDQKVIVNLDGIQFYGKQNNLNQIFKKKNENIFIYQKKLQLYCQIIGDYAFILDINQTLEIYNLRSNELSQFLFCDDQHTIKNCLPAPCNCGCFPFATITESIALISWHNKVFIVLLNTQLQSEFLKQYQLDRVSFNIKPNQLAVLSCIDMDDYIIYSSLLINQMIYILTDGESQQLLLFSLQGELFQSIQLKQQTIGLDQVHMNKVKRYIPASDHRPLAQHILLLQKDKILFINNISTLDQIIISINKLYNLCLESSNQQQIDNQIMELLEQILPSIIDYVCQYSVSQLLSPLENAIQLLLQVKKYNEALFLFDSIYKLSTDKQKLLNKYISIFTNFGLLNSILKYVADYSLLTKQQHQQIVDSLLIIDYRAFYEHYDDLSIAYPENILIFKIQQALDISKKSEQDHCLNPKYLNLSLIKLFTRSGQFDNTFAQMLDIEQNILSCFTFAKDHKLYFSMLRYIDRIEIDKRGSIIIDIILENQQNETIFEKCIQAMFPLFRSLSLNNIVHQYLSQTYNYQSILSQEIIQDQNVQQYFSVVQIIYTNEVLLQQQHIRNFIINQEKLFIQFIEQQNVLQIEKYFLYILLTNIIASSEYEDCYIYTKQIQNFILTFANELLEYSEIIQSFQNYQCNSDGKIITSYNFIKNSKSVAFQVLFNILTHKHDTDIISTIKLVKQIPQFTIKTLNFYPVFKIKISGDILLQALHEYLDTENPSISDLCIDLRQLLPINQLLSTKVGDQIISDITKEIQFQQSCLEVIGGDFYNNQQLVENIAYRGVSQMPTCLICTKSSVLQGWYLGCGCYSHIDCMSIFLEQNNIQIQNIAVCPHCQGKNDISSLINNNEKWFQIIQE
ncbi:hypothetical protein SS50377_22070 [Spironucleus salmonicida]|uniref:RING-type domain-containing protein n=1 Tax=Spironucleus salmonicida TaxID=348837 RepID=V6LNF5_9EUKA|nr:hypothetical protein SS50377_22070 [Spironucleus salmonicida]|eukprot:EST45768.1 Hypothetical protein SS50377_14339 [Spironucleus salmonicida]